MKRVMLAAALLLAAAPALAQNAKPQPKSMSERMVGSWFGSGQPHDRSQMYIDNFLPDGSFRNQHRQCALGKIADEIFEAGRWRMAGNILTIDIATVNGQQRPRSDRYRVNSVDDRIQDYTYLATNFGYKARKVAAGYKMPPCDLSS
jgi:hypothetical protein